MKKNIRPGVKRELVIETKENKDFAWIKYIKRRIKHNQNFMGFIQGPTGSGKTYCAISICELLDPDFDESHIVFTPFQLLKLINSGKLKAGSAILFDEVQIEMSSRNWMSTLNKNMNKLFSTFRKDNLIVIFTSPYSDFLDSQTRRLLHARFTTTQIDRTTKTCYVKPHLIQYNSDLGKYYFHRLKIVKKLEGKSKSTLVPITMWGVPHPSKKVVDIYENAKNRFTKLLNKSIERDIMAAIEKHTIDNVDNSEFGMTLTDKPREKDLEALPVIASSESTTEAAEKLGRHPNTISNIKNRLHNKGIDMKSDMENYKQYMFEKKLAESA